MSSREAAGNRALAEIILLTLAYPVFSAILAWTVDLVLGLCLSGADLQNGLGLSEALQEGLHLVCAAIPLALAVILGSLWPGERVFAKKTPVPMIRLLFPFMALFLAAAFYSSMLFGAIFPESDAVYMPERGLALALAFISASIVPAMGEELFFRGILQSRLRCWGSRTAIIGQAFLFAVLHSEPAQMLVALVSGLVLGLFMELTGKIHLGMLLHGVNNAVCFLELYSSQYLDENLLLAEIVLINGATAVAAVVAAIWLHRVNWRKKLNRLEKEQEPWLLVRCPVFPAAVILITLTKVVI